jgi:hypothetical protein
MPLTFSPSRLIAVRSLPIPLDPARSRSIPLDAARSRSILLDPDDDNVDNRNQSVTTIGNHMVTIPSYDPAAGLPGLVEREHA